MGLTTSGWWHFQQCYVRLSNSMVWYFYLREQPPYEMNKEQHSPTLSTLVTPILLKHNFGTHTIKRNIIYSYTK
jgi:hypothetical protein